MTTSTMTADTIGSSIAAWVKSLIAKYKQHRQIQETIRQLSALSNRELNDMGIGRGDIHAVAHGDPSFRRTGTKTNPNLEGWV